MGELGCESGGEGTNLSVLRITESPSWTGSTLCESLMTFSQFPKPTSCPFLGALPQVIFSSKQLFDLPFLLPLNAFCP